MQLTNAMQSAETFDSEGKTSSFRNDDDDDGDEFEHGDLEAHALDAKTITIEVDQSAFRFYSGGIVPSGCGTLLGDGGLEAAFHQSSFQQIKLFCCGHHI